MCKKSFGKIVFFIKSPLKKLHNVQKVVWKNYKNNKKSLGKIVFFIKSPLKKFDCMVYWKNAEKKNRNIFKSMERYFGP